MQSVVVHSGERTYSIQAVRDGRVRIDGAEHEFSLYRVNCNTYSLIFDGKSYDLVARKGEVATDSSVEAMMVLLNGHEHALFVEDERIHKLRTRFAARESRGADQIIKAPMPGLISRIEVELDALVTKGQGLLVLEAMKMENEIRATANGRIAKIHVQKGRAVEKGDALVSIVAT